MISTRFGVLEVEVSQRLGDGRVAAKLVRRHPRLGAVAGAVGDHEQEAIRNLCSAIERFGCDWPLPPAREPRAYQLQDAATPVTFLWAGEQRHGYAVAYTADEVWIAWEQAHGHDRADWVPAETVERVPSGG